MNVTAETTVISSELCVAVVGVGGAGCNVVDSIYGSLASVHTVAVNTDKSALMSTSADDKIYICKEVTRGEGTHGDTKLGKKCAQVHEEEIRKALIGYDVVFVVAGFGGGTGTGASAVVAEICDRIGVLTFAVVIDPFSFEGSRVQVAAEGYRVLSAVCKNVFRFQNDLAIEQMPDVGIDEVMKEVNSCISRIISRTIDLIPGYVHDELQVLDTRMDRNLERSGILEVSDIRSSMVQGI